VLSDIKFNSGAVGSVAASKAGASQSRNLSADAVRIETKARSECASVAIVEDDQRVCEAIAFQLKTAGFQVTAWYSADEFLTGVAIINLDCIVADIFLPRMNGLELQQRLREAGKSVPIVFITASGDLSIGVQAMRSGAEDVLQKPLEDEALLAAIKRAVERSRAERAKDTLRLDLETRFSSLPVRQRQVFTLITAGRLNKQVAAEMGITERTVKVHRERLRRKMGADSLAELSRMAELLQIHPSLRQPTQIRQV
jgi:RNA polymerase sigma factor (sigma-70 family)